jgi:hypothetical protein
MRRISFSWSRKNDANPPRRCEPRRSNLRTTREISPAALDCRARTALTYAAYFKIARVHPGAKVLLLFFKK